MEFRIGDEIKLIREGGLSYFGVGVGVHGRIVGFEDECVKVLFDGKESSLFCEYEDIEKVGDKVKIRIRYLDGAKKLEKITKGDWIDCFVYEDIFIPEGSYGMVNLGFAMELPEGYEAHLAPRSSTFKTWGVIQTNSFGVIDNSYAGNEDIWKYPVYCLKGKDIERVNETYGKKGTWFRKGDKICQFRIIENQPTIEFEEVDDLGNETRGSFGSTGSR